MKHTIILIAFLFLQSIVASAQSKNSLLFMDIPWGSTVTNARETLDSIKGITFVEQRWGIGEDGGADTTVIVLEYSDGQYGGYNVDIWQFLFYKNRFFYAIVKWNSLEGEAAIAHWEKIVNLLKAKYGKPQGGELIKFLAKMRKNMSDQELWDEYLNSELYLFADWHKKVKKYKPSIRCSTGDRPTGVSLEFMDLAVFEERARVDEQKRLKGM